VIPRFAPLIPGAQGSQATLVNTNGTDGIVPTGLPNFDTSVNRSSTSFASSAMPPLPKTVIDRMPLRLSSDFESPARRSSARLSGNAFCDELANIARQRELTLRPKPQPEAQVLPPPPAVTWSVYCNICDQPMDGEHYHCNTCDDGDYDLCKACVDRGIHCPNADHWLIKRTIKDGNVVNSTTETILPKPKEVIAPEPKEVIPPPEMPGAFTDEKKLEPEEETLEEPTRTCNCCINGMYLREPLFRYSSDNVRVVLPEHSFVTCLDCEDYDLCIPCHEGSKHGHHPAHSFKPVDERTPMGPMAEFLCAPGRNVRHSALCDGCDKPIFGVRHKCLNCPDWDYCSECYKSVKFIHPHHRFVPIYEPIPEPRWINHRHPNIYCDGPLCKDKKEYISGVRYKCAICDDTDFCANCEASPRNRHNRTHPLIMFKTPVRSVSVTTLGEDGRAGEPLKTMGDIRPVINIPVYQPSKVETVAEQKPTEVPSPKPAPAPKPATKDKIEIKDLLTEPIEEKIKVEDVLSPKPAVVSPALGAHFVRETVEDGSLMTPNQRFTQVWTLCNPGPNPWPAGCSVRYVGGDNMLNVDHSHPSSAIDVADATESNVIGRAVDVGEEISFRVLMKAPKRPGTFISYWRLKAADGTPFGHRLWCHIKVIAAPTTYAPATVPSIERTEEVGRPKLPGDFLSLLLQNRAQRDSLAEQKAAQAAEIKAQIEATKQEDATARAARAKALRDLALELRRVPHQIQARANAANAGQEAAQAAQKMLKVTVSELPVTESPAPVKAEEPVKAEAEPIKEALKAKDSGMIFPKLEKESPESSTHEAAAPSTPKTTNAQPAAVSSPAETDATLDIFEDAESVDLLEDSDEEAFLTDEEYDILDASDEEGA
jgi:next to BRCA1 gene 1 protein